MRRNTILPAVHAQCEGGGHMLRSNEPTFSSAPQLDEDGGSWLRHSHTSGSAGHHQFRLQRSIRPFKVSAPWRVPDRWAFHRLLLGGYPRLWIMCRRPEHNVLKSLTAGGGGRRLPPGGS